MNRYVTASHDVLSQQASSSELHVNATLADRTDCKLHFKRPPTSASSLTHSTTSTSASTINIIMSSTAEASSGEPPSLRHHLEKLPQELYDCIYDLTFTANPGIRYVSKPPEGASEEGRKARPHFILPDNVGLLHVDRLSRQKFARSYYGSEGAVFVYDVTGNILRANEPLRDMSSYIAPEHHQLVKDIRCVFAQPQIPADDERFHSRNFRNSQSCLNKAAAAFGGDAAMRKAERGEYIRRTLRLCTMPTKLGHGRSGRLPGLLCLRSRTTCISLPKEVRMRPCTFPPASCW